MTRRKLWPIDPGVNALLVACTRPTDAQDLADAVRGADQIDADNASLDSGRRGIGTVLSCIDIPLDEPKKV